MSTRTLPVLVALLLSCRFVSADFQTGLTAYEAGDFKAAITEWLPLASRGEVEAQYHLARLYASADGATDDGEAVRWYRAAAERGHAKAQNNLGLMLQQGRGGEPNEREAAEWYRRAADQGLVAAQYNLALLYEEGHGVEPDPAEAARWYGWAAEAGHENSQYRLGSLYERGIGVEQSDARAVKWYRRAARHGHAAAQLALGTMYDAGRGVEQSSIKAARWYRAAAAQGAKTPLTVEPEVARLQLAAEPGVAPETPDASPAPASPAAGPDLASEGDPESQYRLARRFSTGDGVPQDWDEALRWYLAAAEQGHAPAGYKLAFLYLRGEGPVRRDYLQAYVWFSRSADRGFGDASTWRDEVARKLSARELSEARQILGP